MEELGDIGSPEEAPSDYPMRLQRYLARAGIASRRGSENLMSAGRVKVNGRVVRELGSKVDPLRDSVEVDGCAVVWGAAPVSILLNKPAGYLTTMSDPQGRPCVASLVPIETYPGLYPLGRLDRQTRGLLLFSTDGNLGHALLHPRHHVDKTYLAWVEGCPSAQQLDVLRAGVELDDGPTSPAKVEMEKHEGGHSLLRITIHEGKNRQVRRMCAAIGCECVDLQRISFGPLELGEVPEGQWRLLDEKELDALSRASGKAC